MQVALFGGRFDPVHNGHVAIAREVLRVGVADAVWMVPDNQHQWNPIVASAKDRLAMLDLVAGKNILVNDVAIQLGGSTETINVLKTLKQQYPKDTFLFVCGSDQLPMLHTWTHWEELKKELQFLIVPRKGYETKGQLPQNCRWLSDTTFEPIADSSTEIRKRIKKGESISDLVPNEVEKYIIGQELYK